MEERCLWKDARDLHRGVSANVVAALRLRSCEHISDSPCTFRHLFSHSHLSHTAGTSRSPCFLHPSLWKEYIYICMTSCKLTAELSRAYCSHRHWGSGRFIYPGCFELSCVCLSAKKSNIPRFCFSRFLSDPLFNVVSLVSLNGQRGTVLTGSRTLKIVLIITVTSISCQESTKCVHVDH